MFRVCDGRRSVVIESFGEPEPQIYGMVLRERTGGFFLESSVRDGYDQGQTVTVHLRREYSPYHFKGLLLYASTTVVGCQYLGLQ